MNRSTFVRPEAQTDIREAALWYESRETGLGIRFVGEVRTSLRHVANNPLRFPAVGEDVRRAVLNSFPYSVYFMTEIDAVVIIAVLHQHRRPDTWQKRR